MSDEQPVPETLESIGQQIRDLTTLTKSFVARFDGNDKRLDAVDARFDAVDARFDAVDARFDAVDTRFDAVDTRFDAVDTRFDELKAQLRTEIESVRDVVRIVAEALAAQATRDQQHTAEHARFTVRLDEHERRIAVVEKKTGSEAKDL